MLHSRRRQPLLFVRINETEWRPGQRVKQSSHPEGTGLVPDMLDPERFVFGTILEISSTNARVKFDYGFTGWIKLEWLTQENENETKSLATDH